MKSAISLFLAFASGIIIYSAAASQAKWQKTAYIPSPASRINDGFFLTPMLGWVVNGVGQIHRTSDGGNSWQKVFERSKTHFRSVGFLDSLNGYAGCLGWGDPNNLSSTDTNLIYHSSNSGQTWTPVISLSSAVIKRGFCGMHVINDSAIVAVGRVRGPAWFYKSTDRGRTWTAKDMSSYAGGLIDVRFTHPDTGLCVGLTNSNHDSSSGVILFTSDGGTTWTKRITTARKGEWCWKINFPSRKVGYVSLQRNTLSPIYFVKTTDGGITWTEKLFSNSYYFVQGIGFANDTLGWAGGNSANPMYETTNGGESWHSVGLGRRINRIRMFSNTFGYAVGDSVYKYAPTGTWIAADNGSEGPLNFVLRNNFPNPFNPETKIQFTLREASRVVITIFDIHGSIVCTLLNEHLSAGEYTARWEGTNEAEEPVASGAYFYRLQTEMSTETKKMMLVR